MGGLRRIPSSLAAALLALQCAVAGVGALASEVGRGGARTADAAAKAAVNEVSAVKRAERSAATTEQATVTKGESIKALHALEMSAKMNQSSLDSREQNAAAMERQARKEQAKAEVRKLNAEAKLKQAQAAAKMAGVLNATSEEQLRLAVDAEALDRDKVNKARVKRNDKRIAMQAAQREYDSAVEAFRIAEHGVRRLTGSEGAAEKMILQKDGSEQRASAVLLKDLAAIDSAMAQAGKAEEAARVAGEAAKALKRKGAQFSEDAAAARLRAGALQRALDEAKQNDGATDEMQREAQAAAKAARSAEQLLSENAAQLKHLTLKAHGEIKTMNEARGQVQSLQKLHSEEVDALQYRAHKEMEASREVEEAKQALNIDKDQALRAESVAEHAKQRESGLNATMNEKITELKVVKSAAKEQANVIAADKKERIELSAKQNEAAQIDIPAGTAPQQAKQILTEKQQELIKYKRPLMEAIADEKAAVAQKQKTDEQEKMLETEVRTDKNMTQHAAVITAQAAKKAKKLQTREQVTQMRVRASKNVLSDKQAAVHSAERGVEAVSKEQADASNQLNSDRATLNAFNNLIYDVANKTHSADQDALSKEQNKVAEIPSMPPLVKLPKAKAVTLASYDAGAAKAAVQVGMKNVAMDLARVQGMAEGPGKVAALQKLDEDKRQLEVDEKKERVLALTAPATPAPTAPTPAPTSILQLMMAPAGKCKDHWVQECPYVQEHCYTFRAMRLVCQKTCRFCEPETADDVIVDQLSPKPVPVDLAKAA